VRTLLLVRHAKSSWDEPGLEDRARPLARRGKRDIPRMAAHLAAKGVAPDAIVTSPARRARATARRLARGLGFHQLMFSELGPDVDEAMRVLCDDILPLL